MFLSVSSVLRNLNIIRNGPECCPTFLGTWNFSELLHDRSVGRRTSHHHGLVQNDRELIPASQKGRAGRVESHVQKGKKK